MHIYDLSYMCLYSVNNTVLLSQVASKDRNELQFWTIPEVGLIDERTFNLSTAVPTVVVTNNVASGRDIPAYVSQVMVSTCLYTEIEECAFCIVSSASEDTLLHSACWCLHLFRLPCTMEGLLC